MSETRTVNQEAGRSQSEGVATGDPALFDTLYHCRSMRRLEPDPVPDDVVEKLIDAAIRAPSSSNGQNWHFVCVRERATKERIAEVWRRGWDWYQETIAAAPPRPGEDIDQRIRSRRAGSYMIDHMADIPVLIFVCVKPDEAVARALQSPSVFTAALRHFGATGTARFLLGAVNAKATGIHATAYPAVQNLLLAARGLGLGAVLTTPHLFTPGAYEEILGIPSGVTLTAVIPVGYPKGRFGPVSRPPVADVMSWDRYTA